MGNILTSKPEWHLANLALGLACLRIGIRLGVRTSILGGFLSQLGLVWAVGAVALAAWRLVALFHHRNRRP